MVEISFTPTFHHVDFVDDDGQAASPDRVRADEPNGFNARLAAIESDLGQFATVVAEIDSVFEQGFSVRQTVWLPPTFATNSSLQYTITAAAQFRAGVIGLMNLILPNGVKLVSARAIGQVTGTAATFNLLRAPVANPAGPAEVIATTSATTNPFNVTATATDPAKALVDNNIFHYHLQFVSGTAAGGAVSATLGTFAITYDPA